MLYNTLTIAAYVNNAANTISPIGEFSEKSYTFATDTIQTFASGVTLTTYDCDSADTYTINNRAAVSQAVANLMPAVITAMTTVTTGGALAIISAALGNTANNVVTSSILVPISVTSNGTTTTIDYPEYFSFYLSINSSTVPVTVFLADEAFQRDYPFGTIQIISPINLQTILSNYSAAAAAVSAMTPTTLLSLINSTVTNPVTKIDVINLQVYNTNNPSQSFDLPLAVACNGGNTYCTMSNYLITLQNLLTSNGSYTTQQWQAVIPGLLPSNTYWIIPNWANAAISNIAVGYPIINPTIPINLYNTIATNYLAWYPSSDIVPNMCYTVAQYKSIGLFIVPDTGNTDGIISWLSKFPDYFLVASGSPTAGQMSALTLETVTLLNALLTTAEHYSTGTALATGISLVTQGTNASGNTTHYLSQKITTAAGTPGDITLNILVRADQ